MINEVTVLLRADEIYVNERSYHQYFINSTSYRYIICIKFPGYVYGLFKASYIVGYVLMGFLNKPVLKFFSARCVILFGLFGHGVCLLLAAVVYTVLLNTPHPSHNNKFLFQVLTCLFQCIQGGLMSSVTLSSLSLGSAYFSDDMGKVNGTYYLGAVIPHGVVPVLANWIYNACGYAIPLYMFGVLAFTLSAAAYVIFVAKDFDFKFDEDDNSGSISSLPYRSFIPLIQSYILTAYLSYLQLALPKFFAVELGFSVVAASTPLFVLMMSIAVVNVIITFWFTGSSTKILHILLLCCTIDAVAAFLIFPPSNAPSNWISAARITTYPLLCLIGMSDAYSTINTTPAMIFLYSTARAREPNENQKHTMSSLWIAGNGLSYALGAYLAGFIDQLFKEDFHQAGVFWGCLALVCVVSLGLPILLYNNSREQYKMFENESSSSVSE